MKRHNPYYDPLVCECSKCTELADIVGAYMEANVKQEKLDAMMEHCQ